MMGPMQLVDLMKSIKDLRENPPFKREAERRVEAMLNMVYSHHALQIEHISGDKGIEAAEDYYSELPEHVKKEQTYRALFNCYCSKQMLDKALDLCEKMKELGFGSYNLFRNSLMCLYMKLEQSEKVHSILQGIMVNDIALLEGVIHEMVKNKEPVMQLNAYSTLAVVYILAGELQKAESVLKKVEGLIDSRDQESSHFLRSLYASTGNLEEVNRLWESLKTTFVKCPNMSYLTMLQALNKLDDIEGLRKCYDEWEMIFVS